MFKKLHKKLSQHDRAEILTEALEKVSEIDKPDVFFTVSKKQIKDFKPNTGAYSIEELKQFSIKTDTIIIIKNYAVISGGEIWELSK